MIIFNTTFHIEDDVETACVNYLRNTYIIKAVNSGFLFEPRLALIHAQHEESGTSYSLQFKVKNIDTLDYWLSAEGKQLQQELVDKFGNRVVGFITLLEEIDLGLDD